MKKYFSFSFQHKVILIILLLTNGSFFLMGYLAKNLTETTILQEKQNKLTGYARILEKRLGPGGFAALLRQGGAEHAPREEKIAVLNQALAQATDEVGAASEGIGVGYYSLELDAILTYGPSASFAHAVGRSIPSDHPGRETMSTNKTLIRFGSMVRGDIMNAMVPIEREGEVIGYIWANELTTDVTTQLTRMARNIFLIMLLCSVLSVLLLVLVSRKTLRDSNRIITGIRRMRSDLSWRIEDTGGELGDVVRSINAIAEETETAKTKTDRAITALQSILNNVDSIIYVCDPQTKKLVYANDYLCTLLNKETLQDKLCYEVLQNRNAPCPFCPQNKLFDHEGRPLATTLCWETKNHLIGRDFLVTDRLITWHDGRLLHLEVGMDMTERKALAMAEAVNVAQREFLARMSHEIRTPMNGVLGMVHLAIQAAPNPAQLVYLKKIQSSASLLLGIINDILDFSRIESGKLSIEKHAFNLREAITHVKELVLPGIQEKGLDLIITLEDNVPEYVVGDKLRLSQTLMNLLGNASKFTLEGVVSLHIHAVALPSGMFRLNCVVNDSGIGMSKEQLESLFSPFSQADTSISRRFGGTGLGLSISKALVELMGGTIEVTSELGKGSAFSFSVELAPADGVEPKEEDSACEEARYDGYHLLLVEDNLINQEIALAILTELGAEVDIAENGEEGVQAFLHKDYALILMDVRMPVMGGLEATQRIRASGKHDAAIIPIIAMTANAMHEDREASQAAGMNGHIAKPIDVDILKKTLCQWLHG